MEPKNPIENPRNEKALYKELNEKAMSVLRGPNGGENYGKFAEFEAEMVKKYQEKGVQIKVHEYSLHHALVGSSELPDTIKEFDLPGGEYEKFIRSL